MNATPEQLETFCKVFDCDVLYRGEQKMTAFSGGHEKIPRFEATRSHH